MKKLLDKMERLLNFRSVVFKIALILIFMSIVTIVVGVISASKISELNAVSKVVYDSNTTSLFPLTDFGSAIYDAQTKAVKAIQSGDTRYVTAFAYTIPEMNGQIGGFQYSLPQKIYVQIAQEWTNYNTAANDLVSDLKNHASTQYSYPNYLDKSQKVYQVIYSFNKSLRIKGTDNYNKGVDIYKSVQLWQTLVTVIGVLLAIILSSLVAFSIIIPLNQLRKSTETLASGDLRVKVNLDSKDEIGMVGRAFNHAVDQLHSMVTNSAEYAKRISESSTDLFSVTNETSRSLGDLNKLVEDLSRGATEQTATVHNALKTVQRAITEAITVTEKTFSINDSCKECSVAAERGKEASTDINGIIHNIVTRVQEIHTMVRNLAEDLKQIQDLVKAIGDITEKTKLLSLNASIEAARAGEQGRGFAVVASNIRQLAIQAQESADHINDVIGNIFEKTDHVVATVELGTAEAEKGSRSLNETMDIFKELVNQVNQITGGILEITTIAKNMSQGNREVIVEMDKVSQISENNMASVEQVSATFQEQYASTVVVTDAARNLQSLAAKLASSADNFKI